MLDPILLRKDLQTVVDRLKSRGVSFDTERFNDLESRRKAVQTETESLQARRNALAKQIGRAGPLEAAGRRAGRAAGPAQRPADVGAEPAPRQRAAGRIRRRQRRGPPLAAWRRRR
ncbi:hypothetical protein G6F68_018961 [Rhizopus microsporus]|nr:hypothetical protein G6F68_018961 [Rhizopus microsporus]